MKKTCITKRFEEPKIFFNKIVIFFNIMKYTYIFILVFIFSCSGKNDKVIEDYKKAKEDYKKSIEDLKKIKEDYKAEITKFHSGNLGDTSSMLIANPIIFDLVVKTNSTDEWEQECLKNVSERSLFDTLFKAVYNGRLQAYNYFTNLPMSIEEIKNLEKNNEEFSRDRLSKLQFVENWYFDYKNLKIGKNVKSVMLAYEIYNLEGEIRGYKPLFRVNLN